jgi:hypothetical protein
MSAKSHTIKARGMVLLTISMELSVLGMHVKFTFEKCLWSLISNISEFKVEASKQGKIILQQLQLMQHD